MEIIRKDTITIEHSEVAIGEVFIRIQDDSIYIQTDQGAISLDDGYYYHIKDDEEVRVVQAKLYI